MTPVNIAKSGNIRDEILNKEASGIAAGFPALLMVWHHLFNKEWLLPGVSFYSRLGGIGENLTASFASAGNICVYGFAFISGYALWRNLPDCKPIRWGRGGGITGC